MPRGIIQRFKIKGLILIAFQMPIESMRSIVLSLHREISYLITQVMLIFPWGKQILLWPALPIALCITKHTASFNNILCQTVQSHTHRNTQTHIKFCFLQKYIDNQLTLQLLKNNTDTKQVLNFQTLLAGCSFLCHPPLHT